MLFSYELNDFVSSCFDVTSECEITYYTEDTDEEEQIDYSNITEVGEHLIKIIATDDYGNTTEPMEATLTILEVEGELYTVTFDSEGGSEIRSKKVGENGSVIEPSAPTKEGYTFLGWYLNDEKFDFNTKITSDITLTAKWEKITSEGEGQGGNGSGDGGGSTGPINVTSVSLNFKTIYLDIGETKTVTARIYPSNATNRTVTWSSSNNNIATVSNGNITGVSAGTVTITATAGGKSASVEVIVSSSSGSSCMYGNSTYNTNAILSVDLTQNGCAIKPNSNPRETLSNSDFVRLMNDLRGMGIDVKDYDFDVDPQKIRNTSGTGLVGYQIVIKVTIIGADSPYTSMKAEYILKSDGTRQFLMNNICKNNICLNS